MKAQQIFIFLFCGVAIATVGSNLALADDDRDANDIRQLLIQSFDKADVRLTVDPIVTQDDVAIADWIQGDLGGRALLRRKSGKWTVSLCAGDALKQSDALEKLGLSKPASEQLAARLSVAEQKIAPSLLERFSRFDGIVAVDAAGEHSPLDPHHQPIR